LTKVDRASMAHGIEVRSPFLDHRIVELVSQIPLPFKLNRHGNKQILRGLLPHLPKGIRKRRKKGFGSPVAQWMISSYSEHLNSLPNALDSWIPSNTMHRTILEHREGSHNHRRRLWSAFILNEWMSRHPET
jgi:asparagine synthase (glutamine-hydrolysing)